VQLKFVTNLTEKLQHLDAETVAISLAALPDCQGCLPEHRILLCKLAILVTM